MPASFRSPLAVAGLWVAFVVVHLWLVHAALTGPLAPLNDVSSVYHGWVQTGLEQGRWVGLDQPWVYPSLALAPIVASAALGLAHYTDTWLALVSLLDAVAFAVLTRGGTTRRLTGVWWLVFLLCLGPIAVGRLDAISVAAALVAVVVVVRRPVLAGVLLAVATGVKVWPVALVLAAAAVSPRRARILVGFVATGVVVAGAVFALGGTFGTLTSFVGQQTGRGLQLEAPVTSIWLWQEVAGVSGVTTWFDATIITYQVQGPGTALASALMTPIMVIVTAVVVGLGVRAVLRTSHESVVVRVLGPLALALTATLVATDKVGSPQYQAWISVPVALGLLLAQKGGPSFRLAAVVALGTAALTQVVYPYHYDALIAADPWMVVVVSVRNLGIVALLVIAVVQLVRAGRKMKT